MTNNDELVNNIAVNIINLSDDIIITLTTKFTIIKLIRSTINLEQVLRSAKFSKLIYWQDVTRDICKVHWELEIRDTDPEGQYNLTVTKFLELSRKRIPFCLQHR